MLFPFLLFPKEISVNFKHFLQKIPKIFGTFKNTTYLCYVNKKQKDVRILTNDLHTDEDNQFYYYHLSYRDLRDVDNSLANTFKSITVELDTLNTKYWPPSSNMPIVYHQLTPAPDRLSGGYIVYSDSAKLSEIAKNGIFIYAEDLDKAQTIRKSEFQNSVWLGVLFAFCLDIIVQLVIKWRNLIRKRRKEE